MSQYYQHRRNILCICSFILFKVFQLLVKEISFIFLCVLGHQISTSNYKRGTEQEQSIICKNIYKATTTHLYVTMSILPTVNTIINTVHRT